MAIRRSHLLHYFIIIGLFLAGGLIVLLVHNQMWHWISLLSLTALYIIWGTWHHHQEHDLTASVILEYISVAAIAMVVLMMLGA